MSAYRLQAQSLPTWQQRSALRLLNLFGWNIRFRPLPGPRGVAIVYPHTSNWDFIVGLLAKWTLGLPFHWLAKESLFGGLFGKLFGPLLRSWGGEPIERSAATGATARLAARISAADWYWLALAPEGTRSYRDNWRSGFYYLAVTAKVPLLIVYLDYPNKELGVVDAITLTGEPELDMAAVRAAYQGHQGLRPERAAPIILAPRRPD